MTAHRILIAGIGNIFLGDDAFGVEVARRLLDRELPKEVRVADFGIRGLDLAYALLDGYEAVVMVDAAPRGGRPGTLYLIEPDRSQPLDAGDATLVEAHSLNPEKVLRLATAMGECSGRLFLVGCEPARAGDADESWSGFALSDPVRVAVDQAVGLIEALIPRLLRGEEIGASEDDLFLKPFLEV
jgi:hydrogenase maturation protease